MTNPNFILLHVASAARSATFYAGLLGHEPIEQSPTFALFRLSSGVMLGLWRQDGVEPPATRPGGMELAFAVEDTDAVHAAWAAQGLPILMAPKTMDFGRTFVAADPDGHRLRVFTPSG